MTAQINTLAGALVAMARDPKNTPEEAAAKMALQLAHLVQATTAGWRDPMEEIYKSGAIACLRLGPSGWSLTISDANVRHTIHKAASEPEKAIEAAHTLWVELNGWTAEPEETETAAQA